MAGRKVNLPSKLDLLLFHRQEREFLSRLVNSLGQSRILMQWVIALWLWFESIGHHDFIRRISSFSDSVVLSFVSEGCDCLRRILCRTVPSISDCVDNTIAASLMLPYDYLQADDLPFTNTLVVEPLGLRFFDSHRDVALKGIVYFFKNVVEIIFDDNTMKVAARDSDYLATRRVLSSGLHKWQAPGTTQHNNCVWEEPPSHNPSALPRQHLLTGATFIPPAATSSANKKSPILNPKAKPWSPETERLAVELRSMFITFSKGYPLTRNEIKAFFNMRFGKPCVETVMIERSVAGAAPMYGRVVFTKASMIAAVLNGQRTAKFIIKGRHLWARIYVPRQASI